MASSQGGGKASGLWRAGRGCTGKREAGAPVGPLPLASAVQEGCTLEHLSLSANHLDDQAVRELSR